MAEARLRITGNSSLASISFTAASPRRDAVVHGLQAVAVAACVGFALALLLDHLGLGLGEKGRVTELLREFLQIGVEPTDLLREPSLLLRQINHVADKQDQRRAFDDRSN